MPEVLREPERPEPVQPVPELGLVPPALEPEQVQYLGDQPEHRPDRPSTAGHRSSVHSPERLR